MKNELETHVYEQSGRFSPVKMSWLARLIVEYAKAHPETLEEFEEHQKRSAAEGGENDGYKRHSN